MSLMLRETEIAEMIQIRQRTFLMKSDSEMSHFNDNMESPTLSKHYYLKLRTPVENLDGK